MQPPTDQQGPSGEGWINSVIRRMSVEQKVGQLLVTHVYGASADIADSRNVSEYGVATPAEVIAKYHLGGVCYFTWSGNIANPRQVAALSNGIQQASLDNGLGVPLLISTDQEQGTIVRVGSPATQFPGNMALGAGRDARATRDAAAITGRELAALGINQNYAPVADVNVNPANPVIGVRSYGADPRLVADLTVAQVRGYQRDAGIAATAKHFPGHGDTKVDSHTGIPEIKHTRKEWDRVDARPFRAAIEAGIDSIMTGHLVFPELDPSGDPATLSYPIMTGILRKELGFDGVVVTDSLGMKGVRDKYGDDRVVVLAIKAGVDMLLRPPRFDFAHQALLAAVRSGEISERRLDQSVARILRLKLERNIVRRPFVDVERAPSVVGTPASLARADAIAEASTTVLANAAGLLPLAPSGQRIFVTGAGAATETLAGELRTRGATATAFSTGTRPTDAAIAMALTQADASDFTIVLTQKAWDVEVTDPQARQQRLVTELLATGRPVVVVSVQDPYDFAFFPQARTCLVTYAPNAVAVRALARVMVGEVTPRGKLPVEIPGAPGTGVVLYPYGHGLSW
ncbi:glycoside hydrolase family 3 protein [Actinopolymorpha alba]|uniref:glycoside hydrolase family 3 protein n=1 Tax=Actinopolymorpha alba TaxID=533267 RepID=UPI0003615515|nr:glycoside hydrolase family 3 protein [Actinopolymorpha alba]